MNSMTANEVRLAWRKVLDEAQHKGVPTTVTRHNDKAAVVVPAEWYEDAKFALETYGKPPQEKIPEWCGTCGSDDYQIQGTHEPSATRNPRFRTIPNGHPGEEKCPRCHPDSVDAEK